MKIKKALSIIRLILSGIILFTLAVFSACQDQPLSIEDIYVAGSYFNGSRWVAYCRNNDTKTDLSDGTATTYAYSVFVSGTDVYIAGEEDGQACYWKNAVRTYLVDGETASAVYVEDGDVYVAGSSSADGASACYWKNGTLMTLTDNADWNSAEAIIVSGSDVYIAGSYGNYLVEPVSAACYWKNGTKTKLLPESSEASACSIGLLGADIYIAGNYFGTDDYVACYWLNGEKNDLDGLAALSVYISGSDVYIAGSDSNTACYWKNGTKVELPLVLTGLARSIFKSDTGVYTSGDYKNGTERTVCYWVNEEKYDLFTESGAEGASIFIVE